MDRITELMQIRHEKQEKLKSIVNTAEKEDRGLKLSEKKRFNELEKQLDDLEAEMNELESEREKGKKEIMEEANNTYNNTEGSGKMKNLRVFEPAEEFKSSTRKYKNKKLDADFGSYLRGIIQGDWENQELRAMAQSNNTSGGYLVPDALADRVINKARAKNTAIQAGARTIELPAGNISLAKVADHPELQFKDENAEGAETQVEFGRANLSLFTLYGIITISQELLQDSQTNLGQLVEKELADSIASQIDNAIYLGNGTGQPLGIANNDDVLEYSLADNGEVPGDHDAWSHAIQKVRENSNIDPNFTVYNPRTAGTLERITDSNSQPLKTPDYFSNLNKYVTNQIGNEFDHGTSDNASISVVGDMSNVLVGVSPQGMRIKTTETGGGALERNQIKIACEMRFDALATVPKELCVIKGILAE